MPSGAKKRKAAKKKKVNDSFTTNPHQGENDGGELSSPVSQDNNTSRDSSTENEGVEVVKREDNSSKNKSKDVNVEAGGNIEIEIGSKSKSSHSSSSSSVESSDDESRLIEKNVVVLEPVPAIESLPEKIDPVMPVDSSEEGVTKVYDETKAEVKKESVVEEVPVVVEEQKAVVSETAFKDDCATASVAVESVLKENGVGELPKSDKPASSESADYVASSTSLNDPISEVNGADREIDTIGHSDRQPPAASTHLTVQKTTSWKGCCGLFDLFSGSER